MELLITPFFNGSAPSELSGSRAELGQNAAQITWGASVKASSQFVVLDDDEKKEAFRKFVRSSGGWNDEEIATWSDEELNALCLQWISADRREASEYSLDTDTPDWESYEADENICHRLFKGSDNEVYFYIGE